MFQRRSYRGKGNETPIEVARIAEKLKLVPVKAVAAIGGNMEDGDGQGDEEKNGSIACG
jgi:hypothetical protein